MRSRSADRMSLAARISVAPSRRVWLAEGAVPVIGLLVAATAALARWPSSPVALFAGAWLASMLIVMLPRTSRPGRLTMTVADRAEFDVTAADESCEGCGRLVDTTVVWPGFAMLALSRDDDRRVVRLPIVMAELEAVDRRPLARFLTWSMRAGGGALPDERSGR